MKTFLRFLGNLATVIIAFVFYTILQLGYAQKKVNRLFKDDFQVEDLCN